MDGDRRSAMIATMRRFLHATTVLLLLVMIRPAVAQVVTVGNTGCPGFAALGYAGQPRLTQTFTMTWSITPAPLSLAGILIGYQSGNSIPFTAPFTCVPGPCGLYPAPFTTEYVMVTDPANAVMALTIPNSRALLFSTFSAQGFGFDGLRSCITLSQAISFAIGP